MALQFLNNGYFAGKVGIGIENPIRLLSLYSDNTETTPRLLIEQDGTGDAVMAFSLTSGQGWSMGIDNSLGDAFMIHNSASGVDSSSQFTILNSGNVGIGTTSPGAKLEIITTRTGTPSSDTNIKVTDDTAQAADVGGSINFTGKYTDAGGVLSGSPFIRASKKNATTGDYGYGLKFGVRATGSGTSNVAMTIDSDSNVGIGTTTPDSKLQIMNNDGSSYRFGYGGSSDVYLDADNVYIRTDNGGANTATFTTTGLGIGTTTPDTKLEVVKDVDNSTNTGTDGNATQILHNGNASGTAVLKLRGTGSNSGAIVFGGGLGASTDKFNIISRYNNTKILTAVADGNVGIGTDSPTQKLHVAGNARVTGAYYDSNNSPGTANQVLVSTATGTDWVDGSGSSIIGGPYLPLAGGTMTGIAGVLMPDNFKLKFGDATTPDLQIYHDGSNSFINDSGTGKLIINSNFLEIKNASNNELMASFNDNNAVTLFYDNVAKFATTSTGVTVTGDIQIDSALLSNQNNTDVDTGTETIASVAIATYTAAFFDFVIKKTTNVRSGTVYACHDGTNVEFTETSTQDLGDTSDVTLSVDISGGNMRLRATTTSDDWSVKSLIRAI